MGPDEERRRARDYAWEKIFLAVAYLAVGGDAPEERFRAV